MVFSCLKCKTNFITKEKLFYHDEHVKCKAIYKCDPCNETFENSKCLKVHMNSKKHCKNTKSGNFTMKDISLSNMTNTNTINGFDNTALVMVLNYSQNKACTKISVPDLIEIINDNTGNLKFIQEDTMRIFLIILKMINFSKDTRYHNIFISNKQSKQIHVKEDEVWTIKDISFAKVIAKDIALIMKNSLKDYDDVYSGKKVIKNKTIETEIIKISSRIIKAEDDDKLLILFSKAILSELYGNRYKCSKFIETRTNIKIDSS